MDRRAAVLDGQSQDQGAPHTAVRLAYSERFVEPARPIATMGERAR